MPTEFKWGAPAQEDPLVSSASLPRLRRAVSGDPLTEDSVARWRKRHSPSRRVAAVFQATPSWLASCVFHVLAMVILGSLAGTQIRGARAPITLTMTASEHRGEDLEFSAPAAEEPESAEPAEPVSEPKPSSQGEVAEVPWSVDTKPRPLAELFDPLPPITISQQPSGFLEEEPTASPQFQRIEYVNLDKSLVRSPPISFPWTGKSPNRGGKRGGGAPNHFDQVVNDFIEYDLGRLRGKAAERALAEFQKLGPEAIPALVRGLNKSAFISASCPVGVISSKLATVAANTNDPKMLEYALVHLGEDVDAGAPHFNRLKKVRRNLMMLFEEGQQEQRTLQRQLAEQQRLEVLRKRLESPSNLSRETRAGPNLASAGASQTSTAQLLLQTAKRYHQQRQQRAAATQLLKVIVSRFPNSREAKAARELLQQ